MTTHVIKSNFVAIIYFADDMSSEDMSSEDIKSKVLTPMLL